MKRFPLVPLTAGIGIGIGVTASDLSAGSGALPKWATLSLFVMQLLGLIAALWLDHRTATTAEGQGDG